MRACSNLGMLDQRISDAVKARQEVDLRIGEKGGERIVRGLRRRKGVVGERCFQRKESVEREAGGGMLPHQVVSKVASETNCACILL